MRKVLVLLLCLTLWGSIVTKISMAQNPPPSQGKPSTVSNVKPTVSDCDLILADPNKKKERYRGWGNWAVGPTISYSLIQYNLADKKSSLNATAAGVGAAFRFYSSNDLADFGEYQLQRSRKPKGANETMKYAEDTTIQDIPPGCRAGTYDINENTKISSLFSFAPAVYAFQEKDADDMGVQLAVNIGIMDDIFSFGAGWNLSGDNAGEWFVLFGPSFAFRQ